jgi:hypothetical protein
VQRISADYARTFIGFKIIAKSHGALPPAILYVMYATACDKLGQLQFRAMYLPEIAVALFRGTNYVA